MEFKEEIDLIEGWKFKASNGSNIIVSSNELGYIAVIYDSHEFGDIQTLLFRISGNSIKIKSFPSIFTSVDIDIDNKVISVKLISQDFVQYND
ncbi:MULTISPECIES: hypothetical protein [Enterococcus]|uniref:hypothetical protein n=1 Tax=Enterococcus TaxID=1350 RepID=UPI003D6B8C68